MKVVTVRNLAIQFDSKAETTDHEAEAQKLIYDINLLLFKHDQMPILFVSYNEKIRVEVVDVPE